MQGSNWVIIGDLVDSRNIQNREEAQQKLNNALESVNHKYHESIIVPFKITLGDEFVGVLNSYQPILDLLQYLDVKVKDIEVRYGIGYGEFNNYRGQGYKNALKAVGNAKKNKFKVHLFNEIKDKFLITVNLFLHLYFNILSNYNRRQKYIIYLIVNGKTQKKIADIMGTSQSSISQSLNKLNWGLLVKTNKEFYDLQQYIGTKTNNFSHGSYIAFIGAWSIETNDEEKIRGLLDYINQKYANIIRSQFILTSLSSENNQFYEFQGLFYNEKNVINMLLYILAELYSEVQDIYLGIGIGNISTEVNDKAIGMDGTAFYTAREAIRICFSEQIRLDIKILHANEDNIYSLILSLFTEFVQSWSFKQSLAVRFRQEGLTQNEIKEKMNLSRSTVVEHLQRAGWNDYRYIIDTISYLFELNENPT